MLSVSGIGRTFGERVAVENVTFDVPAGEIFGLLGPNGAGKTTTLRMVAGLIPPTTGDVRFDGEAVNAESGPRLRPRVGFLTESPGLWEHLTVADNLLTYARLFNVPRAEDAVEQQLRRFDLWDRRGDRAALLSKGMKQKLALARALVHAPSLILLDEPTANLDPQTARAVRDLLLDLRDRGCAIIVSTHNLDEIERVAGRIGLIRTRLIAIGEPAALRREIFGRRLLIRLVDGRESLPRYAGIVEAAGARDVEIREDGLSVALERPDRDAPAIIAALVNAGAAVREAFEERPPLEDVYVKLLAEGTPS